VLKRTVTNRGKGQWRIIDHRRNGTPMHEGGCGTRQWAANGAEMPGLEYGRWSDVGRMGGLNPPPWSARDSEALAQELVQTVGGGDRMGRQPQPRPDARGGGVRNATRHASPETTGKT